MKKNVIFAMVAVALVMGACNSKKPAQVVEEEAQEVSFEQSQIQQKIKVELDSIANLYAQLKPVDGIFSDGKIVLSDEEKLVAPDYLMNTDSVFSLTLLSQKYRALGIFATDMEIAKLYGMDTSNYETTITKLATDINDPSITCFAGKNAETLSNWYNAEDKNGRINYFWETSTAALLENLYVISQNSEKFLPAFDDETASNMTYHLSLVMYSLGQLSEYDENIKSLNDMMQPLNALNAMTVDEMKGQLESMKPAIASIRQQILK